MRKFWQYGHLWIQPASLLFAFLYTQSHGVAQTASFSVSDSTGCVPFTVFFTNQSTGAQSYLWDFDDGLTSTLTNPVHIFYGTQSYRVVLHAYDSLMNTDSFTVTITVPSALPFFNAPLQACPGQTLKFSVFGNYDPDNVISWDFGDGATGSNSLTEHAFQDTGIFNVALTVSNAACGVTKDSNTIYITPSLIPSIHVHPDFASTTICPGAVFPFFYDEYYAIQWDFGTGDNSTDPYPSYTYDSVGTYLAGITVINDCGNSNFLDTLITVSESAPVTAKAFGPSFVCRNDSVTYFSSPGSGYLYEWDFGTGDLDSNRVTEYAFTDTGTFNVRLITTNLCGMQDTAYIGVKVTDSLKPVGWMSIANPVACPNEPVTMMAPSGHKNYLWDFGDGALSAERNPTHAYTSPGTYPVTLALSNSCGATVFIDTVLIDLNIITPASFTAGQVNYCYGGSVYFSGNASSAIVNHYWEFGDGYIDTIKNPEHVYPDTGLFTVKYAVTNLCGISDTGTLALLIDMQSSPVSAFSCSVTYTCPDVSIGFANQSSDTGNVVWDFGDGTISSLVNPVHAYANPGNYTARHTVVNNCGKSSISTKIITISNSGRLPAPELSCSTLGDSVVFTWTSVAGAQEYAVTTDSALTWSTLSGSVTSIAFPGETDSTYFLSVKALGTGSCPVGAVSGNVSCTYSGTGIRYIQPGILSVSPNPSDGMFTVRNDAHEVSSTVIVYSALGEMVKSFSVGSSSQVVDLSVYPSGVYLFRLQTPHGLELRRVLVIR